jgi:hypothetical protein
MVDVVDVSAVGAVANVIIRWNWWVGLARAPMRFALIRNLHKK